MRKKISDFWVNYRPSTSDEEVIKEGFDNDIFFKNVFEYKIQKNHTIIDVGAHIGVFTLTVAKKASEGKILAFEPCNETFDLLKLNVDDNNLKNVITEKIAVSSSNGSAFLHFDDDGNWGHSITAKLSDRGEEVETKSLNTIFDNYKLNRCDLIKFNCEGAEFGIILNTDSSILNRIETMIVLFHEDLTTNKIGEIKSFLETNGFKINIRDNIFNVNRGWLIAHKSTGLKSVIFKMRNDAINLKDKLRLNLILFKNNERGIAAK